ncbi:hypothetical protein B0H11DRAFT_2275801, partial [Mycena galericulata]
MPAPVSLSLSPFDHLPLSPSPSPPSDQPSFDIHMLAHHHHHIHHLHPALLYAQQGFDYAHPLSLARTDSPPPGPGKRYRSAPPKTFQCAGYGECRMVFSRSEHLARHIRKHTGERPFACHCGKQFSRLDNLRQHAQTVHSAPEDKPRNEAMMRALAGVNANMMAGVRGRRRFGGDASSSSPSHPSHSSSPHSYQQQQCASPGPMTMPMPPYTSMGMASPYPSPSLSSSSASAPGSAFPPALMGAEYAFPLDSGSEYFPSSSASAPPNCDQAYAHAHAPSPPLTATTHGSGSGYASPYSGASPLGSPCAAGFPASVHSQAQGFEQPQPHTQQ